MKKQMVERKKLPQRDVSCIINDALDQYFKNVQLQSELLAPYGASISN